MVSNQNDLRRVFDYKEGDYFIESHLADLHALAVSKPSARINSQTFLVCSLDDLSVPERTLLIYTDKRIYKTTKSLKTLFDEYGKENMIPDWTIFHETLHACVNIERRNFPYLSTREAFLDVNKKIWININHIHSYHRLPQDNILAKTRVLMNNGYVVDLPLTHSCFQHRLQLDNCWLITLRRIKQGYFEPNRAKANICTYPIPLSTLLINEEECGEYKHRIVSEEEWQNKKLAVKLSHLIKQYGIIDKDILEKLYFNKN